MSQSNQTLAGNRVIIRLYVIIVVIAGGMGFILGTVSPKDLEPELFGVFSLPPTPAGVALYGMVTVAVGFALLLGLVIFVSRRYDDESA